MVAYPSGVESRVVTGRYADFYFDRASGKYKARPKKGYVFIYPAVQKIKVGDTIVDLEEITPIHARIDEDGVFHADVIVTDQPGIEPHNNWTWKFISSWDQDSVANVPILSTDSAVININNYFGAEEVSGVIVTKGDKGDPGDDGVDGRGIESINANGAVATITYTDGSTSTIPLPSGGANGYQYVHAQSQSAKDWVIEHNLNQYVTSCYVVYGSSLTDPNADQVLANWSNMDLNTIIVHHGAPCSGMAVI